MFSSNNPLTARALGVLDSVTAPQRAVPVPSREKAEQAIVDSAAAAVAADIRLTAAGIVQEWVATDSADLASGEGLSMRLIHMLAGAADPDNSAALDSVATDLAVLICDAAWDYMTEAGVSDEDMEDIFDEDEEVADSAAGRARDLIVDSMPQGEQECCDSATDFAFKPRVEPVMDAAFKKVRAVRDGKVKVIRKRVSGVAIRTAGQKMAIKKARMKSHGAAALMHRAKSMRVRMARGL